MEFRDQQGRSALLYLRRSSEFKRFTVHGIATGLLLFTFFACGTDSNESSASNSNELLQQVTPSERLFTHDDVDATGFKTSKEYDVEGLTGATDVLFGFWRPDGSEAKGGLGPSFGIEVGFMF